MLWSARGAFRTLEGPGGALQRRPLVVPESASRTRGWSHSTTRIDSPLGTGTRESERVTRGLGTASRPLVNRVACPALPGAGSEVRRRPSRPGDGRT
jgi:hypothetical protein